MSGVAARRRWRRAAPHFKDPRVRALVTWWSHPRDCPCSLCHVLWDAYRAGVPQQSHLLEER